jgi:ribosomal protein S18 acetylase RimI-like enzyme
MTSDELHFRFALPPDTSNVVDLVESAYRGDASRVGWTTEADLLDGQRTDDAGVSGIIGVPKSRLVLVCCAQLLVGCVHVKAESDSAYIGMFAIRPNQQARGIGRRLLEHAEQCARSVFGLLKTHMTVIRQREELIRWYERRGYCRTSRREPFPYGDARFGLPRRPDLEFIVLEKSLGA